VPIHLGESIFPLRRLIRRLTAVMGSGSPGMPPSMSQLLPRRDSVEFRGRAPSLNGNGESLPALGVERLIESLKHENGEYKKILRELDDRCIHTLFMHC